MPALTPSFYRVLHPPCSLSHPGLFSNPAVVRFSVLPRRVPQPANRLSERLNVNLSFRTLSYGSRASSNMHAPQTPTRSDMSDDVYHRTSDETMNGLLEYLEVVMDTQSTAENGWEVEYDSGVMTLSFGDKHGTYVLNKQPPNKQIWLSSPISGPKRYDYDTSENAWFYARDGVTLGQLLAGEWREIIGEDVVLPIK